MSNHREHRKHNSDPVNTDHIRNVPYLLTHDLTRCECGFYGWIEKEA